MGDPPGSPATLELVEMCKRVEVETQGMLVIKPHFDGEIVSRFDITEAVRDGALDMGMTNPANDMDYLGDKSFLLGTAGFPAGPKAVEYAAWFYIGDGKKYVSEVYKDFCYVIGMPYFSRAEMFCHSNVKLETAADLKGIKFRTFGLWAEILAEGFGASVVTIPGGEIYSAMERGVIDAFEYASPAGNWPMGWHEITKYIGLPGVHSPLSSYITIVNKDSWNALPSYMQQILESEVKATGFHALLRVTYEDGLCIVKYSDYGTEFFTVSDELQREIAQLSREWVKKTAAEDPLFKEIWENQQTFIKTFRSYNEHQPEYSIFD